MLIQYEAYINFVIMRFSIYLKLLHFLHLNFYIKKLIDLKHDFKM